MNNTRREAEKMKSRLIEWRRTLHQYPELGFEEYKTSQFVQERLAEFGIEYQVVAKTGVVGLIKGKTQGPTVALRADMDGLPIPDNKEVAYASKINGKGHLCGHDAHTAMLLAAAKLLSESPPEKGNVKLIFQPAEEGLFGARTLIEHGVLENPAVDAIAGLHVNPTVPVGHVTCALKEVCAAADFFSLEILGRGGHAAHPHLSIDPITVAAQVITALQQVISRQIDPLIPAVLTIGQIHGGSADNAIAPSVKIGGTVRTLDPEMRNSMEKRIEDVIKGVTSGFGASYRLDYRYDYPPVINDSSLIPILRETAADVVGVEHFSISKPSMGGEDFSFYAEKVPGIFFRLGVRNEEKGMTIPLHNPLFDLDEDALPYGASMLAQFALDYCRSDHYRRSM